MDHSVGEIKPVDHILRVGAPLAGVIVPLEKIPDRVFALKMVGDGVSIDPTSSVLLAPFDGKVTQLHKASHAVTIKSPMGPEVLIHIGIDTVTLKGKGFHSKVKEGQDVIKGQVLIEFDLDTVALGSKSLLTQVLLLNTDQYAIKANSLYSKQKSSQTELSDNIFEVISVNSRVNKEIQSKQEEKNITLFSENFTFKNPIGLHARPAAVVSGIAKAFSGEVRLVKKTLKNAKQANAKSIVSLLSLEADFNSTLVVELDGLTPDQQEATKIGQELVQYLSTLVEKKEDTQPVKSEAQAVTRAANELVGVSASSGLAVGNIYQVKQNQINVSTHADTPLAERQKLYDALSKASSEIQSLYDRFLKDADAGKAAIFSAHLEILDDPDLLSQANLFMDEGDSAAIAWRTSYLEQFTALSQLNNELMRARANDLKDVGERVLRCLAGEKAETHIDAPSNAILIAEDLTPSDTANLDQSKVLGFCTVHGGASSHVAILARALDIPAIAGINIKALDLKDGTPVILDGNLGVLKLNPSPAEIAEIHKKQSEHAERKKQDLSLSSRPALTQDGVDIKVMANIAGEQDAFQAVRTGAQGVGLLRSEFLFLDRKTAPTEEEQFQVYRTMAKALGKDLPLTIRTLDVGGDKPLPYLPIAKEENPFLGERGIRVSLNRPELFRVQLRAILRVSKEENIKIMFPMISTLEELREAKAILKEEQTKLNVTNLQVGIMIEVPSSALLADQFASEVDFFSIGTNDLTQYVLAMDRGHPKLAKQVDGLHPAVLKMIKMTVDGAHTHGIKVSVCGGIASDPKAVPILLGLGVDELSVSVPSIPSVKAQIRTLNMEKCKKISTQAINQKTAQKVRALSEE